MGTSSFFQFRLYRLVGDGGSTIFFLIANSWLGAGADAGNVLAVPPDHERGNQRINDCGVHPVKHIGHHRCHDHRTHRRHGGYLAEFRTHQPRRARNQPRKRHRGEKNAKRGRNAFPALEFQPDRITMADHGQQPQNKHIIYCRIRFLICGRHLGLILNVKGNTYRAFGRIKYKGGQCKFFASGSKDICRPNISRTNRANIAFAEKFCK